MTTDAPILAIDGLTMRFGGILAINELSFTAQRRQITALIGPNGAGKTTVFNCITGFYRPSWCTTTARHSGSTVCTISAFANTRKSRAPSRTSGCFPA